MIRKIEVELLGAPGEPGSSEVSAVRVIATFNDPGDSDSFTVMSVRSTEATLAPTPKGPFRGATLSRIQWPAPDPSTLKAVRTIYIRPGTRPGEEVLLARSNGTPIIEGRLSIQYLEPAGRELGRHSADGVFGAVSSFFDLFEDRDVLRSFWHAMSLGAEDLNARAEIAARSSKIWRAPVFSTRRWQRFKFSDETGVFDAQHVVFAPTVDGSYGFDAGESLDAANEAYWNTSDELGFLLGTGPDGFVLQGGTSAFDTGERTAIDEVDGTVFSRAGTTPGEGVVTIQRFPLRQSVANIAVLTLDVVAKGWGTVALPSGVVAEIWNKRDETWDLLGQSAEFDSEPASLSSIGGAIFGEDLPNYVDTASRVAVRVRSSQASDGVSDVNVRIDLSHLDVGAVNAASRLMRSPADTTLDAGSLNIEVRDVLSDTSLEEGVDYYVDLDRGHLVWLRPYSSPVTVFLVFDKDFPQVYSIDSTVVAVPELRKEINVVPTTTLRDGVDYVLNSKSRLRLSTIQHQPGRETSWWAPKTLHDEQLIYRNFGTLTARLDDERSSVEYLRRIQGLWFAFFSGPSIFNVRSGAQILMNAPFAFSDTRVRSIDGNTIRLSNGQVMSKPSATPWSVSVGESVIRFQPLTQGVKIVDKVTDPLFMNDSFVTSLLEEQFDNPNTPIPLARVAANEHFFLAEVDGFSLGKSGTSLRLIREFLDAIKPVYTHMGLGLVLAADCGEIIEGPCGLESTGNCLCVIAPPGYDLQPTVAPYIDLDLSEVMQREPYANAVLGAVDVVANLPEPGVNNGDVYYVRDIGDGSGAYYAWYEPQATPGPTIDLGRYDPEPEGPPWADRIPALHPGYPLDSWVGIPRTWVPAGTHGVGSPPFGQWQAGGSWVRLVGPLDDLPRRSTYRASICRHFNPDVDTSSSGVGKFAGTARNHLGQDIASYSGSDITEGDGPTLVIGSGSPAGTARLLEVPVGQMVTKVRRIKNLTRTAFAGEDVWVHGWMYDFVSDGLITFDPLFEGVLGEADKTWADGEDVEVEYRTGILVNDLLPGEAGYSATTSLHGRAAQAQPIVTGRSWGVIDEAYAMDGDFPGAVVHAVQMTKNANIESAPQFDTANSHYVTMYGRFPGA